MVILSHLLVQKFQLYSSIGTYIMQRTKRVFVHTWQMTQVKQNAPLTKCAGLDYCLRTSDRRLVKLHQNRSVLTPSRFVILRFKSFASVPQDDQVQLDASFCCFPSSLGVLQYWLCKPFYRLCRRDVAGSYRSVREKVVAVLFGL
jgi:hypothetical protein